MKNDYISKEYTCNTVIMQGYSIYDEWKIKKLSSRKIVSYVECAVSNVKQNK